MPKLFVAVSLVLVLLLGLLALPFACGGAPAIPVILISIDTLRARSLGCYGYDRPTSPGIDRFARDSILFEEAFAPEPQTLPSHISLMTGVWPKSHGVFPPAVGGHQLAPAIATLAETLGEHGHDCAAFVNVGFLSPGSGIERGFAAGYDYFAANEECPDKPGNRASRFGRSAEQTNARALAWLDQRGAGAGARAPFLFLHYFDVHSDIDRLAYDSPPEYRQRFCGEYHGGFSGASSQMNELNEKQTALPEEDLRYLRSLYDAGVAYTDDQVAALLDELRARGLYDRSLIVLTADHGEEFQEHGHLMHTQLYDECVHVPLLIKLPKSAHAGTRVTGQVSLVDVMPTLLELLGIEQPTTVQGKSLVPRLHGEGAVRPLGLSYCLNGMLGLREPGLKLLTHEKWTDQVLLYDLTQDPGEKQNIARREPERAHGLAGKLRSLRDELPDLFDAKAALGTTPEQEREMNAIGYVSKGRKTPPPPPPGN